MEQRFADLTGLGPPVQNPILDSPPAPLTVTHVLEHLFCPRFTYFEYVLGIPERQERRLLVQKGRQAHEERKRINPSLSPQEARRGQAPVRRSARLDAAGPAGGGGRGAHPE